MLMSFSVPVFAGMLFLDLMTKSGTFRFFALAALTLVLPVSGASAGSLGDNGAHAAPFGYPSTALNAPATLAEPPAAYVQIGSGCSWAKPNSKQLRFVGVQPVCGKEPVFLSATMRALRERRAANPYCSGSFRRI